jgi:uncharacterized membrane protein
MIEKLLYNFLMSVGGSSIIGFLFIIILIYTGVLIYCVIKIKSQCKSITAMSAAMKNKVEEKELNEIKLNIEKMEKKNTKDHDILFKASTEQLRILSFLEGKAS